MGNPEACGKVRSVRTNPPLSEKLALKRDRRHVDPNAILTDFKDDSTCETGLMCSRSRSLPEFLLALSTKHSRWSYLRGLVQSESNSEEQTQRLSECGCCGPQRVLVDSANLSGRGRQYKRASARAQNRSRYKANSTVQGEMRIAVPTFLDKH